MLVCFIKQNFNQMKYIEVFDLVFYKNIYIYLQRSFALLKTTNTITILSILMYQTKFGLLKTNLLDSHLQ